MSDQVDIYEFPAGYAGRRTYVRVAGHDKLVARCYTYYGADGKSYLHPDHGGDCSGVPAYSTAVAAPQIMKSMGAYVSPVDGSRIASRADHRDHLKRHDLIEVGNERVGGMARPEPATSDRQLGEWIKHRLDTVKAMPQQEYNNIVEAKVHANG